MPKFGGYHFALVVTCGLTRFTRVFPCTKCIAGEDTIKILMEGWFQPAVSMEHPKKLTRTRTSEFAPTLAGTRES